MASSSGKPISSELIQKYLDDNRQLIIATLYKQNQSNLKESALYQAKLQQNLMYLAGIADAQLGIPFPPPMQPSQQYIQQPQLMNEQKSVPQRMRKNRQAAQKHVIAEILAVLPQPPTDDPKGNVG